MIQRDPPTDVTWLVRTHRQERKDKKAREKKEKKETKRGRKEHERKKVETKAFYEQVRVRVGLLIIHSVDRYPDGVWHSNWVSQSNVLKHSM